HLAGDDEVHAARRLPEKPRLRLVVLGEDLGARRKALLAARGAEERLGDLRVVEGTAGGLEGGGGGGLGARGGLGLGEVEVVHRIRMPDRASRRACSSVG